MKSEKVWTSLLFTFSLLLFTFAANAANAAEPVEFRDYDAKTGTFRDAVRECAFVTDDTRILEDGWWQGFQMMRRARRSRDGRIIWNP